MYLSQSQTYFSNFFKPNQKFAGGKSKTSLKPSIQDSKNKCLAVKTINLFCGIIMAHLTYEIIANLISSNLLFSIQLSPKHLFFERWLETSGRSRSNMTTQNYLVRPIVKHDSAYQSLFNPVLIVVIVMNCKQCLIGEVTIYALIKHFSAQTNILSNFFSTQNLKSFCRKI